jgi:hypothetical protein
MIELEEEQKMLDEMALKPPPEHKVGVPIDMFEQEPIEVPAEEEPGAAATDQSKEILLIQSVDETEGKPAAKAKTKKKELKAKKKTGTEAGE